MTVEPVLAAQHLRKQYGAVHALVDASIEVRRGEVHGLVGENGAGKTTLVRLLAGIEQSDARDAEDVRREFCPSIDRVGTCAIVPQHPRMAASIPVLHNLIVGAEPRIGRNPFSRLLIDTARARDRLEAIARRFDIELDLGKHAGSLNGTETRLAALLAALTHDPTLLILDEPTVGLAPTDQERVLATVRALRNEGMAILYISHDLAEVCAVADRVTVLARGITTGTFDPAPDPHELASLLFDHHRENDRFDHAVIPKPIAEAGVEPAIAFEEVSLYDRYSGRALGPVTFSVAPGTITAIAGVRESGLDLLEQYLSCEGELSSGAIRVAGHRIPARISPGALRKHRIAFVPSDRFERAAALEGSVEENATIADRLQIYPWGIRMPGEAKHVTKRLLDRFNIRTNRHVPLGSLSGGTIQKLILARELDTDPTVCIIAEPTAGLDLQSQAILLASLREIAGAGAAVLILSSSIDAVTSLAQDVVVLHDGSVADTCTADQSDRIARAFAGLSNGEPAG